MTQTNALSYMLSQISPWTGVGVFLFGMIVGAIFAYSQWKTVVRVTQMEKMKLYLFSTALVRFIVFFIALMWVAYPDKNIVKIIIFFIGFMVMRVIATKKVKKMLREKKHV